MITVENTPDKGVTKTRSEAAIKRRYSSLSSFFNYYYKLDMIDRNPISKVTPPRIKKQYQITPFSKSKSKIHGITNTMLANSLKELETDGLVERKQYDEMPVRVEYNLTEKTKSLIPILLDLKKWGEDNL